MANKVLVAYLLADVLFVIMGAIMLGFSIVARNRINDTPTEGTQAVINLLYSRFPLTAGIVNSAFYFFTFVMTLPALITPGRGFLKFAGYLATFTVLFSMVIGVDLWTLTLRNKEVFSNQWNAQTSEVQDLMQTAFTCCGYFNSTSPAFVTDSTCPSPAAAALQKGCATTINSFASIFVDDIFTAVFGMCGVGGLLVLATACLMKDRKERERFRYIDEKNGVSSTF